MENRDKLRSRAYRFGIIAEYIALVCLLCKGYRPLHRRFRCPAGEIDLILMKGRDIIFVEVKARKTLAAAYEAITVHQQRRLSQAVRFWLSCNSRFLSHYSYRMDAFFFAYPVKMLHIKNIFPLSDHSMS